MACIDNADEVRFAVADAATDLAANGCSVALIDLTERGSLTEVAPSMVSAAGETHLLRPRGIPALAAALPTSCSRAEDGNPPSLERTTSH